MSYRSSLSQRRLDGIYFSNSSSTNQSINETNTAYLANLQFVQDFVAQAYSGFMKIINPIFTGTMTGGSINLTGELLVPTITSNTNFTSIPTITLNNTVYNISTLPSGTIKMLISNISPPVGLLLCNGATYATTDYPNLFAVIQYTYGGSGSSFNVPNFQSYFPIGGNGVNSLGCSTSNYVTGNNVSGANNTFSTTSLFGGSSVAPLITIAPEHNHNTIDPGHEHSTGLAVAQLPYITTPPLGQAAIVLATPGVSTTINSTNIQIDTIGTNIQSIDPISNLSGVNASPPYVAVFYYIAI
jgi:microcystin-dependent protein